MVDNTRESALEQITKLLAMAEHATSNPNEAAVAAAKATRLMRKYNIEVEEARARSGKAKEPYDRKVLGRNDCMWNAKLAATIAKHNFGKIILSPNRESQRPDIVLVAQPSNAEVIEYLYNYLLWEIRHLGRKSYHTEKPAGMGMAAWNRSYGEGAVIAIDTRLAEENRKQQAEEKAAGDGERITALIVVKDTDLTEAFDRFFPSVKAGKKAVSADENAFHTGYRDGKQIPLHKGIAGK